MKIPALEPVSLKAIRETQGRLTDTVLCTPLVRLNVDDSAAEIFLKQENLQPIGSFELRGAGNAMQLAKEQLQKGIWTASAGNMAQGSLGALVNQESNARALFLKVPQRQRSPQSNAWLLIFRSRSYEGMGGLFFHAFSNPAVMAGHGTIGLEILEDLPDVGPWSQRTESLIGLSDYPAKPHGKERIDHWTRARLRKRRETIRWRRGIL